MGRVLTYFSRPDNTWVAWAIDLDNLAVGQTPEQALADLQEIVNIRDEFAQHYNVGLFIDTSIPQEVVAFYNSLPTTADVRVVPKDVEVPDFLSS